MNASIREFLAVLPIMPGLPPSRFFPAAESADEYGLVCVGGQLSPQWLLDAYSHGLFPWPLIEEIALPQWWSPDPRAIFELDGFHVSRSLARTIKSGVFTVTSDTDFDGVITGCATAGDRRGHTWLNPEMTRAYKELHELGHAHSIEAWQGDALVGGTYGVAIGTLFAAESMFYRKRDASKVALVSLARHLVTRGFQLLDIQQLTEHTASLGAIEIPRSEYLRRLEIAVDQPNSFGTLVL